MKKNPNVNKYNKGLKSVRRLKPSDDACSLPNSRYDYLPMSKKRRAKLDSQRRRFGFDETETYDLGYTSCVWLYSHIKALLDIGGKMADFEWDWWNDAWRKELRKVGVDTDKYTNDKMVFEYICELLEEADALEEWKDDEKIHALQKKAFAIFGVMLPRAWW